MLKHFNKAVFFLAALSFSSHVFAAKTTIKLENIAQQKIEITGDVYNQTSEDIYTKQEGFSPVIKPHAHSDTQFTVSGLWRRVEYRNQKGDHGCIFEFSTNEDLGYITVDDYPVSGDDYCRVVGQRHITLIVG